jgi:hypothetical protein
MPSKKLGPQPVTTPISVSDPVSLLWPRQMDIPTAARYICATAWAVELMCRAGSIVAYKQGKKWAVDRLELDAYVQRRHAEAVALLRDFAKNSKAEAA